MKKRKRVFIILFVALIIGIVISSYYFVNKRAIQTNNQCSLYVDMWLSELPDSETLLDFILEDTSDFIENKTLDKGFYFSYYQNKFIDENTIFGLFSSKDKELYKQRFYNEVIMLRLKALAFNGEKREYNELFFKSIYDIESNFFTSNEYVAYFVGDSTCSVEWNSDLYKMIEQPLIKVNEECEDIKLRFYILNELVLFYSSFEETADKEEYYRKELVELIKNNKDELKEALEASAEI